MALTPKQKRFCDEYLIDLNATQAAIRAGYSEKTARTIAAENLAKPNIQEYISERMNQKDEELIAGQNEVLEYFTSVMRNECEKTADRLDAAKMLGKRYGIGVIKVEANVNDTTRSELAELLAQRKARGEPDAPK